MSVDADKQRLIPGHDLVKNSRLTGRRYEWGVEIAENTQFPTPNCIEVLADDLPALITWLVQQWAAHNAKERG